MLDTVALNFIHLLGPYFLSTSHTRRTHSCLKSLRTGEYCFTAFRPHPLGLLMLWDEAATFECKGLRFYESGRVFFSWDLWIKRSEHITYDACAKEILSRFGLQNFYYGVIFFLSIYFLRHTHGCSGFIPGSELRYLIWTGLWGPYAMPRTEPSLACTGKHPTSFIILCPKNNLWIWK